MLKKIPRRPDDGETLISASEEVIENIKKEFSQYASYDCPEDIIIDIVIEGLEKQGYCQFEEVEKTVEFGGFLATFNTPSRDGTFIEKGAFIESIKNFNAGDKQIPVIDRVVNEHKAVGFVSDMEETEVGLLATFKVENEESNKDLIDLIKSNHTTSIGLSIGYEEVSKRTSEKGNILEELNLLNVGIVTKPENE